MKRATMAMFPGDTLTEWQEKRAALPREVAGADRVMATRLKQLPLNMLLFHVLFGQGQHGMLVC